MYAAFADLSNKKILKVLARAVIKLVVKK